MAAPAPPPHLVPVNSDSPNAYNPSRNSMSGTSRSGNSSSRSDGRSDDSVGPTRPWPHIKDLRIEAEVNPNSTTQTFAGLSNTQLLYLLEIALNNFGTARGVKRLDKAVVEYLRASYIASVAINSDSLQGEMAKRHRHFVAELGHLQPVYNQIQEVVEDNNVRNGTRPTLRNTGTVVVELPSNVSTQQKTISQDGRPVSFQPSSTPNGISRSGDISNTVPASLQPRNGGQIQANHKIKPPVSPKPPNLHSTSNSVGSRREAVMLTNSDPIAQRFANLRFTPSPSNTDASQTSPSNQSSSIPPENSKPVSRTQDERQNLPNGFDPRGKVTINTGLASHFPKPPSPTYTPTSSVHRSTAMQPPKSARTTTHDRRSSTASTTSIASQSQNSDSGRRVLVRRRKAPAGPSSNEIEALRLFDYMQKYDVLIIDVRSREEYDSGHIWATSSMCIEPTALRPNMSAEELLESLVLAPETEQALFDQRNQFDVIVYHDQSTPKADFIDNQNLGPNPSLRYLHDALYVFNQEKPLKRPPVLLMGGLDAWVDISGQHGLKTSDTAHRPRVARPLARRPMANADARISLQKRRHRDFNPLDEEEERKWVERARSESVVLDQAHAEDWTESSGQLDPEAVRREAEEFAKRYPDVTDVEQQQNGHPQSPRREPPRIPNYPAPPVSTYQQPPPIPTVPSRPAPAVARPSYSGVSDRIISPSTQSQPTQQLPPYIPPKLKRLPRVGLHNFGVTCYMNATLQCLSATIPLTALFLDMQWKKWVQRDNWKGTHGVMAEYYYVLLRNLWESNDVDTIRPTNFRKFCARLNQEWGVDRQQDAKEFLEFIIDMLHEDLNANWHRNPLQPLTPEEEARRERTPELVASKFEWSRYEHRDLSPLTQLFAGQHVSRLQCTTCHNTSTTYEPFYSISVEIPPPSRNGHPVSVYDCLRSYCSAETLAGDEVWRCPHCKKSREATKRITITRAPDFLVLHFKRFSASHSERARKIHTPVNFPLEGLDLEPFMLPQMPAALQAKYAGRYSLDVPHHMRPPYRYDAYAVMRHLGGTMTSGHYITLVKDKARGVWREFNDDRVGDFRPEDLKRGRELQNGEAYIVFYQRVIE